MSQNTLLIDVEILQARTNIHGNIDATLVEPDIKFAQDAYIMPIIGTGMMNVIQGCISAGSWAGKENYKALLDNYLIDALVYYTLAESDLMLSYQLSNKGLVRKTGDSTQTPSMEEIASLMGVHKKRAEFYARRAKDYLIQQAPFMYPEYINPGSTVDTQYPQRVLASSPVYLGVDRCGTHRPLSEIFQGNRGDCGCD